ncbi:MAG: Hsp70 family protein, partial [Deltaproteobacteria bacterium]|nr:Hsp70 family protein [Deltaproteobacteria bacterium]
MKKPRYLVGIDLGTTNTVVASADTTGREDALGRPAVSVFPIEQLVAPGQAEPRELLPSNVYVPAEGELAADDLALSWGREPWPVGELAKQRGARTPGHLVVSAKSWLSHGAVDRTAAILPWGAPEGIPRLSPIDASSRYLGHVRAAWDHAHPDEPLDAQDVVLTVPASFDEVARELTLRAARSAGLESLRLVEEPQAAFYDWLAAQPDPERPLGTSTLAIVVDVGGGTTDLTLIHADASGKLSRIAVGDHLLLGGDNMDLLLAKTAETRLGKGALDAARFAQLLASCRSAKERLLSDDAPPSMPVTVLGSGSRLIGGTMSTTLTREDVERLCVDGFFPEVDADARVDRKRAGLVEFGLPYASDPAITRHVATFLARHRSVIEEVLGTGRAPLPDAVLLNGG